MQDKIRQLLSAVQAGDYKALARSITIVENELQGYEILLKHLRYSPTSKVVGITGPPGAGKSTLVNSLLHQWLDEGKKIAVIAVDPSSPFNYGALLGDRIRMSDFYNHPNIFIRSLASRGALGGLSAKILEITDLIRNAPFDIVVIETVGVGQSEVEISGLADCTVVTLVPEAGDEVQTLKAGIMEIADVFVVNKSDRDNAENLYRSLRIMVHEKANGRKEIPVFKTIATAREGIAALANGISSLLQEQQNAPERKLQLLTEKSWQLIQSEKMRKIDRRELQRKLREKMSDSDFNLYRFLEQFY